MGVAISAQGGPDQSAPQQSCNLNHSFQLLMLDKRLIPLSGKVKQRKVIIISARVAAL